MEFHKAQHRMIRALNDAGRKRPGRARDVPRAGAALARPVARRPPHGTGIHPPLSLVRALGLPLELLPRHLPVRPRRRHLDVRAEHAARRRAGGPEEGPRANLTPEEAKYVPPTIKTDDPQHFALLQGLDGRQRHDARRERRDAQGVCRSAGDLGRDDGLQRREGAGSPERSQGHHGRAGRIRARRVRRRHRDARRGSGSREASPRSFRSRSSRRTVAPCRRCARRTPTSCGACPRSGRPCSRGWESRPARAPETRSARSSWSSRTSVADKAGFKVKDVLVSMDGQPIQDREVFNRLMVTQAVGRRRDVRREARRPGGHAEGVLPASASQPSGRDPVTPTPSRGWSERAAYGTTSNASSLSTRSSPACAVSSST